MPSEYVSEFFITFQHDCVVAQMEKLIPDDIYERIFLTLNVRNLIRCKSVCKSWKSIISRSHFIKAHLNLSYSRNENGHKRIGEAVFQFINPYSGYTMHGFSNGLICINDGDQLLVGNPSTREGRTVPKPLGPNLASSCWGFGYDSLTDDYKVVQGAENGSGKTCFQVFSLKSNVWNVIGEVNYRRCPGSQSAVLCNGAIHWDFINDKQKQVILSFDLSKEEFKEIPQPDFEGYKFGMSLGLMEECLCITRDGKTWVMKKYNAKESWERVAHNCILRTESVNEFVEVKHDTFPRRYWFIGDRKFWGGPTIVESLVSPHLQAENE